MDFPVIIIDNISNSIKNGEDEEDLFIEPSQKDDYNFVGGNSLRIQTYSNNDDGDSGIHESSEGLGPSPAPSQKFLIDSATSNNTSKQNLGMQRSLSANSLIERKRSFSQSFKKSTKNRKYSIDTNRQPSSRAHKSFSPYKLMILDEDGKTILVQKVSRDSVKSLSKCTPRNDAEHLVVEEKVNEDHYMNDLCQIHLLLIIMKIVLGSSITIFGFFLKSFSDSLETRDCGYWASSLLLVSGVMSIYFATDGFFLKNKNFHKAYLVLMIFVSSSSVIVCMVASINSGIHGNWISFYADDCSLKMSGNSFNTKEFCCIDKTADQSVWAAVNRTLLNSSHETKPNTNTCYCIKLGNMQRIYIGFTCKYLFSSLKDYFVLICSLMAVASGCETWFVVYLFRYHCKCAIMDRGSNHPDRHSSDIDIAYTEKQLPSPIIPAISFPKSKRIY